MAVSLLPRKHIVAHDGMIVALDGAILLFGAAIALAGRRRRWCRRVAREAVAILFALVTLAQLVLYVGDHYVLAIMGRFADAKLILARR